MKSSPINYFHYIFIWRADTVQKNKQLNSFVNLDYTLLVMFNKMLPDRIYHNLIGLANSIVGVFKQYRGYRIAE
jgi:hypothetical protein